MPRKNPELLNAEQNEFWPTIARHSSELALVAGPLLEAVAQTAHAMDRAQQGGTVIEELGRSRVNAK
jgi:hypothetical protein